MRPEIAHPRTSRKLIVSALLIGGLTLSGIGLGIPTSAEEIDVVPPAPISIGILNPVEQIGDIDAATVSAIVNEELTDPRLGADVVGYVIDGNSNEVLVDINSDQQMIPASTLKLYTAIAALNILGAETRFATTVMRDQTQLTLVGGGDPTLVSLTPRNWKGKPPGILPPPSIQQLADQTIAAIGPTTEVFTVAFDDSLFAGPQAQETWPSMYLSTGEVAPAQGLTMDYGVTQTNGTLPDPAKAAAQFYVDELIARGLQVTLTDRAPPSVGASELTRVESATVTEIVERMMTTSNNTLAEYLAHHIGGSQGDYSFAGGAKATKQALVASGIGTTNLEMVDGSGLSRSNRTTAKDLVSAVQYANNSSGMAWAAITGMPVAGISGTLINRYDIAEPGRGIVRAKTGTLSKVVTLTGTLVTTSGELLIFAFIANEVPNGTRQGEAALDEVIKALVQCGCRVA
ncbi:MAG: D-alanyl-D-alanine carboxypeptidase/D-alanyl-D-alanine-endopeptidase [Actinomycetes bacterium]